MAFQRAIFATSLLLLAAPAGAGIYRCVLPGGSISYQELPCEPGAAGAVTTIPTAFPDHTKARDHRIAHELELQAERERARAREDAAPVYVVGPPFRWRDTRGASGTPRSRPRT